MDIIHGDWGLTGSETDERPQHELVHLMLTSALASSKPSSLQQPKNVFTSVPSSPFSRVRLPPISARGTVTVWPCQKAAADTALAAASSLSD